MPTLEQVVKVLSAFEYDGIELAGFFDHATVEKYPDEASRKKLVQWITEEHGLELVGYAPGPYGDFGRLPWATGSDEVVAEYEKCFEEYLKFCVDCGIPSMRVPVISAHPHDADDKAGIASHATWKHAQRGAKRREMLWSRVGHRQAVEA
jgi:sugar phosphate isomerase/epimerase